MTALSTDRITKSLSVMQSGVLPPFYTFPIADNVLIYAGALVVQDNAGNVRPGRISTTDVAIGCARTRYDNTVTGHAAGALKVDVQRGVFFYDNDGSNPVLATTQAGTTLYVIDDHTVSLSSNGSTRAVAGTLVGLDPDGSLQVMVFVNPTAGPF